MREHYSMDKLADYSVETIAEPMQVVNPAYRDLDGQVRSKQGKLNRLLASFGAMHFEGTLDDENLILFCIRKRTCKRRLNSRKVSLRRSNNRVKKRHIILIYLIYPRIRSLNS